MLFLAASVSGWLAGILIGIVTPFVALLRGQLPPILAPMVPFIAISNVLLVLVYFFSMMYLKLRASKQKNPYKRIEIYVSITLAAVVKFLILTLSIKVIVPILIVQQISNKIAFIMTTPQLITALIGGGIALLIYEVLYRTGVISKYGIK